MFYFLIFRSSLVIIVQKRNQNLKKVEVQLKILGNFEQGIEVHSFNIPFESIPRDLFLGEYSQCSDQEI